MDRDVAIQIKSKLNSIVTTLGLIASSTVPTSPDSRSVSSAPAEDLRSAPEAEPEEELEEEPEAVPEKTTTRKRTTSK